MAGPGPTSSLGLDTRKWTRFQRMFCPFYRVLRRAIVNAHFFHTTAWIKSRLTCSITAVRRTTTLTRSPVSGGSGSGRFAIKAGETRSGGSDECFCGKCRGGKPKSPVLSNEGMPRGAALRQLIPY